MIIRSLSSFNYLIAAHSLLFRLEWVGFLRSCASIELRCCVMVFRNIAASMASILADLISASVAVMYSLIGMACGDGLYLKPLART